MSMLEYHYSTTKTSYTTLHLSINYCMLIRSLIILLVSFLSSLEYVIKYSCGSG